MAGTEKTDGLMGRIAVSKAGRDKGIRYAVIGTNDDGTLMLCDGKVHKAAKPRSRAYCGCTGRVRRAASYTRFDA